MKLHLLYSGAAIGGAQNFAFRLAAQGFHTATILDGEMQEALTGRGNDFVEIQNIREFKWDIIVLSDLRALLYFVKWRSLLICKEIYFIPHSDKLLKYSTFIKHICNFFNIVILPTTRSQMERFRATSWYLVGDLPETPSACLSDCGIIYFGRFDKVKRLRQLVSDFVAADEKSLGPLTLQGVGEIPLPKGKAFDNVNISNTWLDGDELGNVIDQHRFNIVYSRFEGLSLSSLEALGRGLTPLFFSQTSVFNYGLTGAHLVRGHKDFSDLGKREFSHPVEILAKLRESSQGFEFLYG